MFIGAPIIIEELLKLDHIVRLPGFHPRKFTHNLDLRAHLRCRGKTSTHAQTSHIVRGGQTRDIRALDWRPSLVVFDLQSQLLIFYKQLECIVSMMAALDCDFCMFPSVSGIDQI